MNNKVGVVAGGIILLVIGIYAGTWLNKKPEVKEQLATVTGAPSEIPTEVKSEKGTIGGYLIYPSSGIPEEVGVCAQSIDDPKMINCVKQIKDKKYETGVGYQMDLSPGNYYVYAFYKDMKAYYDEFVICGLKAECKSHTKIPVVVTAGSVQDKILPHDWYDTTPTATVAPTTKPTVKPIITLVKINPNIFKIIPSNTPTPIPTIAKIIIQPKYQIQP